MVRTWIGAVLSDKLILIESALCYFLSSFVDIDHFIIARSFRIEDIFAPHPRGFFHCTSLTLTAFAMLLISGLYLHAWWLHTLAFIYLTATFTHQLRDGLRHGLWFFPFGSTRPVPYPVYLLILFIWPMICCYLIDLSGQLVIKRTSRYKYSALAVEEV
jgi:hypothetical protein